MSDFDILFARLVRSAEPEALSPLLREPLRAFYEAIVRRPYDPDGVAAAAEPLLQFLVTPEHRTNAHCVAVDRFVGLGDGWPCDWEDEPAELADILGDMGGALHDSVSAPEIAENFESTPEQLLARVRSFRHRSSTA